MISKRRITRWLAWTSVVFTGVSLIHAQTPANQDWPYYGNDLGGMRYVNSDQINPANVATLAPAWIFRTGVFSMDTSFEAQPIVVGGTMYISSPNNHVFALDATTGALRWTYTPTDMPPLSDLSISSGQCNRGVAVGNNKVYLARLDAMIVALDAATGREVWKTAVDRWQDGYTETMAPLFINGRVIVGSSGSEFNRRGHVSSYDAETGRLQWRFNTVPAPGEFGGDTWTGESWRNGGGTVWSTPVADAQLGLLYVTTGNPAPDLNGSRRAGNNLFTDSIIALDLNTGTRRWHFQEVHHDLWDYDAVQPAHLFTMERNGQQIPAVGHANKNGNYFLFDRRDGTPLIGVTEMPVPTEPAWQHPSPTQPVPAGDPLVPHTIEVTPPGMQSGPMWTVPSEKPVLMTPGFESGPQWTASAYSPRTRLSYMQAGGYEPWLYQAIEPEVNSLGSTGVDGIPGVQNYGLIEAVNPATGKIVWTIRTPERTVTGMVVAGDLVFFGEGNGRFNAVDAATGRNLWSYRTDMTGAGGANGSPAVYTVNGRQYVAMAFGGNSPLRSGQVSPPGDALIVFALPQPGESARLTVASPPQINTGAIPDSAKKDPLTAPPAGARVVDVTFDHLTYHPRNFAVLAGERIAVHIINNGPPAASFAVRLPAGISALRGMIEAGKDAYFDFTAPAQPGAYDFFSPLANQKALGATGFIRVSAPCTAAGATCISAAGITSAGNLRAGAVSPAEVVSIFGAGLGPAATIYMNPASGVIPGALAGTRVLFDGVPAPLLFVETGQINAIVPNAVAGKTSTQVQVERNGVASAPVEVSVAPTSPSLFTMSGSGRGQAAVINQDGSLNTNNSPATRGSVITLYATGVGQTNPVLPDGQLTPSSPTPVGQPLYVNIGNTRAELVEARVATGLFAGIVQLRVRIPDGVPSGNDVPVRLAAGTILSPPAATITIR